MTFMTDVDTDTAASTRRGATLVEQATQAEKDNQNFLAAKSLARSEYAAVLAVTRSAIPFTLDRTGPMWDAQGNLISWADFQKLPRGQQDDGISSVIDSPGGISTILSENAFGAGYDSGFNDYFNKK